MSRETPTLFPRKFYIHFDVPIMSPEGYFDVPRNSTLSVFELKEGKYGLKINLLIRGGTLLGYIGEVIKIVDLKK